MKKVKRKSAQEKTFEQATKLMFEYTLMMQTINRFLIMCEPIAEDEIRKLKESRAEREEERKNHKYHN